MVQHKLLPLQPMPKAIFPFHVSLSALLMSKTNLKIKITFYSLLPSQPNINHMSKGLYRSDHPKPTDLGLYLQVGN